MYFQRKPGKVLPRVYVYVKRRDVAKALPRDLTRSLDGKEDWQIEEWMREYAALHSLPHRKLSVSLGGLDKKLDDFIKFLESQDKWKTTVATYRARLEDVLPFFMELPNYNEWYLKTGKLYDYMLNEAKLNPHAHNRANIAFRAFYRWMQDQDFIQHRHSLMLRNRPMPSRNTPLKYTLTPKQVLNWVRGRHSDEMKLIALLGYFFSLRTDELFGLKREAFLGGSAAAKLEAAKVMKAHRLYGRLVVNITECRRQDGTAYVPSSRKKGGIVACFNEQAAKLIVEIVKEVKPGRYLLEGNPGWLAKKWSKTGIEDITLKDLRRASLYWLGHYSKLTFTDLQHHARHSNPSTTALYTRRPDEAFDKDELDPLDLDA